MAMVNGKRVPNVTRGHFIITDQSVKLFHFISRAARRQAEKASGLPLRSSYDVTLAVQQGVIPARLVSPVLVTRAVYDRSPPAREVRQSQTISLVAGRPRTIEEFATHCAMLAQACPNGFRTPSAKVTKPGSTSLVELAAIAAGQMTPTAAARSDRGKLKRARYLEHVAFVKAEQDGTVQIDPKYLHAHARRRQAAPLAMAA